MSPMRCVALLLTLGAAGGCAAASVAKVQQAVDTLAPEEAALLELTTERVLVRDGVRFALGDATLAPRCLPALDAVAKVLEKTDVRLTIEGHTDDTGGPETNRPLSLARAAAVKRHLVSRGVDAGRLELVGYGMDRPVASNTTDEGRARNRRVEFKVR